MAAPTLSNRSKTLRVSICVPEALWRKLKFIAKKADNNSASNEVRKALEDYIAKHDPRLGGGE